MPPGKPAWPLGPGWPTWSIYALAHGGKTLFWVVSDLYFTWIVLAVGGVGAGLVGLGIGLSILLAAGADYVGGRLLARVIASPAQAGRTQFHACIATALALVLFAGIALLGPVLGNGMVFFGAMMAALVLFRLTYASLDITQNAVPALIARDQVQRVQLVMWRNIAGGGVRIALSASFVPLMLHRSPHGQGLQFLALALVIALVATLAAAALRTRLITAPVEPVAVSDHTVDAGESPQPAFALRLIAAMSLASLGMTLFQQLEPFFVARVLAVAGGGTPGTVFMTACAVGAVVCQPAWRWLMLRYGARCLRASVIVCCLVCIALLLGRSARGSGWALSAGMAYGTSAGGLLLWLWATISDCAPNLAIARIGRFSASAKLGQTLGLVVAGAVLQAHPDGAALARAIALGAALMIAALLVAGGAPGSGARTI